MHASPRRLTVRVRPRWVWAAVGTLAVAVVAATSLRVATSACAAGLAPAIAPPATQAREAGPGPVLHGRAVFYSAGAGSDGCSLGPLADAGLYVSVPRRVFASGASCGSYLAITGPGGTVTAEIVDLCPGCRHGGIDMSQGAFRRVAGLSAGTALVSYRISPDPQLPGPLAVRIGPFASASRLALQVINHGNPLASVAVSAPGSPAGAGWVPLHPRPDGYWVAPGGAGPGPFEVRITDVLGHQVTLGHIRLAPHSLQRTRVFMYRAGAAAPRGHAAGGRGSVPHALTASGREDSVTSGSSC